MRLRALLAAGLLAALRAGPVAAQPYDPAFRWRTLETPHFRVHFHQGEERLAQDVAREAERAHARLAPRLDYSPPGQTEIVLSDDVDDANGSATPLPYNTMRLYAVPPASSSVLGDYRDWVRQLVQHEYVHVLHMDHVGGFPAAFNGVFGKLWVPNGLVPPFMTEGLAVVNEAEDPGAGRNASALFDMFARALALDGPFPRLQDVSNPSLEWPVGNVPYLLGGRFMGYLQARYGPASLAGFVADQGSVIWPYHPSTAGRRWFGGQDFPTLWKEYATAERAYGEGRRAAVRARPVTTPAPLTRRGGTIESPRFSPDGRFVAYYSRSLDDRPGLRRVALDGRDLGRVTTVDANGALAVVSPREALVAIGDVRHEYRLYDDLYLVDLDSGRRRRVTRDERATDPDVSRDGRTAVYVRRTGDGTTTLVRRELATGAVEVLFGHRGADVGRPRIAPDGAVAFELHEAGRWDVALWRDGTVVRVTDDDALDSTPAFTPDGRFLLFSSDRGGVFNLYAWEVATGALRQVTNVELGALQPDVSPDGKTIVFIGYSRAGYDLATVPLDPRTWLDPTPAPAAPPASATPSPKPPTETSAPPTPTSPTASAATASTEAPDPASSSTPARAPAEPPPPPGPLAAGSSEAAPPAAGRLAASVEPPEAARDRAAGAPDPEAPDLPSRPYSPWRTLRPYFWLPIVAADGAGTVYGALTAGTDVVLRHAWAAQAWWSASGKEPGYALAYQGAWSWPRLDLASSLSLAESPGPPDRLQRVWTIADAGLTFTWTRLARALAVRVSWSGTTFESVEAPAPGPPPSASVRFDDGFLSQAGLLARYSDARRYVHSISPEEGRDASLRLRVAAPELGSDYAISRLDGALAQYLRVPFTRHAVLALRLAGGLADGTIGTNAPFELGGAGALDALSLLPGSVTTSANELRGYASGALAGTGFVLGNLELRFPLAAPRLGRTTWPIFLRRVHGALFLDAGDAFDRPGELPFAGHPLSADELRFSAGAELRLEIVLGYAIRTNLRLGVARAFGALLGAGREADVAAGLAPSTIDVYVTAGASF